MSRLAILAAAAFAASSGAALAHSNDARLDEQHAWIEAGREDGSITWREGLALRKKQAEIARVKAELEADGHLSRADRRVLHKMQDEAALAIEQEASDGWRRLRFLPRVGR